jgi:hypothetical protein
LAEVMNLRGNTDEASAELGHLAEQCSIGASTGDGYQLSAVRHEMAHMLDAAGRFMEAEIEYRAVLTEFRERGDGCSIEYRHLAVSFADNLRMQQKDDESVAWLDELIASCDDLPADDQFLLAVRHKLGDRLAACERWADAEAEMSAVLAVRAELVDMDDVATLEERHCRVHVLEHLDRDEEVETELRDVAKRLRDLLGPEDKASRRATWCHAMTLRRAGRLTEALSEFERCLAAELVALSSEDRDILVSRWRIAETRRRLGEVTVDETVTELRAILPGLVGYDGEDGDAVNAVRSFLREHDHPSTSD